MRIGFRITLFFVLATSLALSSCSLLSYKLPHEDIVVKQGQTTKEILKSDFSILVWNIYKGEKDSFDSEYNRLKKNQDILILQEDMCCTFKNYSDFHKIFAKSFSYLSGEMATGVSTLSKSKSTFHKYLRSHGREPIINTPKMALITKYKLDNGEELLIANIHSLNFVSNGKWKDQLKKLAQNVSKHNGPVVLAGDFNTWNDERVEVLGKVAHSLKLKAIEFNGKTKRMEVFGNPLDHVFYKGLKLKQAEVINSDGSDHLPMSIQFSTISRKVALNNLK